MVIDRNIWYEEGKHHGGPHDLEEIKFIIEKYGLKDPKVSWPHLPGRGISYSKIGYPFHIYNPKVDEIYSFNSYQEIKSALDEELIQSDSQVFSTILPQINGWDLTKFLSRELATEPPPNKFVEIRSGKPLTIFSGSNNAGKTYLLKSIKIHLGSKARILLTGRIKQIGQIQYQEELDKIIDQDNQNFLNQYFNRDINEDTSSYQIERMFSALNNDAQDKLTELLTEIIGDKIEFVQSNPNKRQSPWLLKVNDQNVNVASTGTRLLINLLSACFDPNCNHILIDEPELGLSPKTQKSLSKILLNSKLREFYFPHVKSFWISTHSHLFLDRSQLSNNFIINKTGGLIEANQVTSISRFHLLQFDMLGLDLQSLFLPEAILLVEGVTDYEYFRKLIHQFLPDSQIALNYTDGEGNTLGKLNELELTLGEIKSSPYQNRTFVVLDKVHSVKKTRVLRKGVLEKNLITLKQNGIEYYYPSNLIEGLFKCSFSEYLQALNESVDSIILNGRKYSKRELNRIVCDNLNPQSFLDEEIMEIIRRIKDCCTN